jgi:prefoldin subunit 5
MEAAIMLEDAEYYMEQCKGLEADLQEARAEINDLHSEIDSLQQELQCAEERY